MQRTRKRRLPTFKKMLQDNPSVLGPDNILYARPFFFNEHGCSFQVKVLSSCRLRIVSVNRGDFKGEFFQDVIQKEYASPSALIKAVNRALPIDKSKKKLDLTKGKANGLRYIVTKSGQSLFDIRKSLY